MKLLIVSGLVCVLGVNALAKPAPKLTLKAAVQELLGEKVEFTETMPRLMVDPFPKPSSPAERKRLFEEVQDKYGLSFISANGHRWIVSKDSLGTVGKGEYRLLKSNHRFILSVNATNAARLVQTVGELDPQNVYEAKGLDSVSLAEAQASSSSVSKLLEAVGVTVKVEGKNATVTGPSRGTSVWKLVFHNADEDQEAEAKSIISFLDSTFDKKLVSNHYRGALRLTGPSATVKDAEALLATHLDTPRPQVRLRIWSIQINNHVDDYESTAEQLRTIDEGAQLERNLLQDFRWLLTQSVRGMVETKGIKFTPRAQFLWEQVGFSVNPLRPLSPPEMTTFFCYAEPEKIRAGLTDLKSLWEKRLVERKAELRIDVEGLTSAESSRRRQLGKLLDAQIDLAHSPSFMARTFLVFGGYNVGGKYIVSNEADKNQLEAFLTAYWAVCNRKEAESSFTPLPNKWAIPASRPSTGVELSPYLPTPKDLTRLSVATDSMIRDASEVYYDDLSNQFFEPYRNWVQQIASEGDDLAVLGLVDLAVTSGAKTTSDAQARSFFPFTLYAYDEQGKRKPNQAVRVALSPNPALEALNSLAEPEPNPTYVSIAPGIGLSATAQVLPGSDSARLKIDLHSSTKADVDKDLVSKGIAPVDVVESSKLTTDVVITASDLFELGTQGVQTTRLGEPAWSIPILRDIPLIGKFLFQGPNEPTTRQQSVLMLVDARIVPRSIDFIRQ